MNQRSWRHHYIPKFYLKGFVSEKGTFKIFDIKKGKFVRDGKDFSPESYFFEKKGNTLANDKSETDFLESSYAKETTGLPKLLVELMRQPPKRSLT